MHETVMSLQFGCLDVGTCERLFVLKEEVSVFM